MTGPRALQLDPGTGHFSLPVQTLTYRQLCMAACCMSRDAAGPRPVFRATLVTRLAAAACSRLFFATERRCFCFAFCRKLCLTLVRFVARNILCVALRCGFLVSGSLSKSDMSKHVPGQTMDPRDVGGNRTLSQHYLGQEKCYQVIAFSVRIHLCELTWPIVKLCFAGYGGPC